MKRLIFILVICLNIMFADEFIITDIYHDPSDISARTEKLKDINDEFCAIIKIRSDVSTIQFHSNQLQNIIHKNNEIWLYVSPGIKYIELSKTGFIKKGYNIPIGIESNAVYILEVSNKNKFLNKIDYDLFSLTIKFNVSEVYVKRDQFAPIISDGNIARFELPQGKYKFNFSREGYLDIQKEFEVYEDTSINIEMLQGKSNTTLSLPGIVMINTNPSSAEIFINNKRVGITPYQNQLIAGNYTLTVKKEYYHQEQSTFIIEEGQTKLLPIINLEKNESFISIETLPDRSEVLIDNIFFGITPIINKSIESGEHSVIIQKESYQSIEKNIQIQNGDDKKYFYELTKNEGGLAINSDPSNATVYINGKEVGKTPYKQEELVSGKYSIKIEKQLYTPIEKIISIEGTLFTKTYILTPNFGNVNVIANDSKIFMDDSLVGVNQVAYQLVPGKYSFRAVRENYYPDEKEVFINIGKYETINLKPQPKLGSVTVLSEPSEKTIGSVIFVNQSILADKTTPAIFPLPIGNYDITVKKKGFQDLTLPLVLGEGDQKKLIFQLNDISDKRKFWSKHKAVGFIVTVALVGAGVYCNEQSDKYYEDYLNAVNSSDANIARLNSEKYREMRNISYSVSVLPAFYYIFSSVKKSKYK